MAKFSSGCSAKARKGDKHKKFSFGILFITPYKET